MDRFESIEWTNTWFEYQTQTEKKRILFIGDSIVNGAKEKLRKLLDDEYYTDFICSSRSIDGELYKKETYMYASYCKYDVIFFNNGLHGGHMDTDTYEKNCEEVIKELSLMQKDAKILLGLSTPVTNGEKKDEYKPFNDKVIERNEAIKRISKKLGLTLIDNYTLLDKNLEVKLNDGYHYTEEGSEIFAKNIVKYL